jgi:hypothetical protein
MKLRLFAATAFSLLGVVVVSPSFAQDQRPPTDPKPAESEKAPTDRPANPPQSQDIPGTSDVPQTPPPPADQAPLPPPPPSPLQDTPPPPPDVAPLPGAPPAISPEAASNAMSIDGFESFLPPPRDQVTPPIGEKLSPLLVTTAFGFGYAAIKHPDLVSSSLSGSFVELTAGTELNHRFRLSFALTSFQTTIHRTAGGWAEGDLPTRTAAGLRAQADPVEPTDVVGGGGVEVRKTLHVHSIGPRLDFLPLGSQGPYIGLTTGLGVIQDIGLRAGGTAALRIGGEWRPYQVFGVGIEAGAHGQIYTDSRAAIPYAAARLQFYLDPEQLSSRRIPTVRTFVPSGQQRTLPNAPLP